MGRKLYIGNLPYGTQVGGRNLTVNEARPKAAPSGGGFGRGQSHRRQEPRW